MTRSASLIGLAIAKSLTDELRHCGGQGVVFHRAASAAVSARRTDAGTLVVWGSVNASQYQHTGLRRGSIPRTYVRAVDEIAAINALVTGAIQREAAERPVLQAREALYLLCESRNQDAVLALADQHPEMPQDYDQMSLADCAAWTPLLQALPVKAAAVYSLPPQFVADRPGSTLNQRCIDHGKQLAHWHSYRWFEPGGWVEIFDLRRITLLERATPAEFDPSR